MPSLRRKNLNLYSLWDFKDCFGMNFTFTLMKIYLTFFVQGLRQLLVTEETVCIQTYVLQPEEGKRSSCRNVLLRLNMMHSSKPNHYLKVSR